MSHQKNHAIRKIEISSGVGTTRAGTAGCSGSTDGTGTSARFYYPTGVITDGTNLYVADLLNSKIRKIVISTGVVTTLAEGGGLYRPNSITSDGTNLYVTESQKHRISKIVISTGVVTIFAGSSSSGNSNGTGTAASFRNPNGITTDGTYLYVADWSNHRIRKIVISTRVVTTLVGDASPGYRDGTWVMFRQPSGIISTGNNLYVTEGCGGNQAYCDYEYYGTSTWFSNHTIRKIHNVSTKTIYHSWNSITGIENTSYTHSGLNNGTTFYYKIGSVNTSGAGSPSNEVNAQTSQ